MKKENLPKYVYRKLTPTQRKQRGAVGTLYFSRRGEPSMKFECQDVKDPEFQLEYALLLTGKKQREMWNTKNNPDWNKRNFKALIRSYIQTPQYRKLKPNSAKDYDEVMEYIEKTFGNNNPTAFKRHHVIKMRDANIEKLRFANYTVQVIRILFEHAIDKGWMEHNPARGVSYIKSDAPPRMPWPQNLVESYRQKATGRELLLFELLLATGQRIQDVLDFKWTDIRPIDGTVGIDLIQNKTGKPLWIPIFKQSLLTLLENTKRRNFFILTNLHASGPWSYRGASQAVLKIRKQIGAEAYDIHSLRYSAACEMALAGLSDETIGAVTGQSMQMVKHYTKSVRQMARAKRAIQAREQMALENRT